MNAAIMAVIMLAVVLGCILWNKIPMNFVMFVVPFVCLLGLGYSLNETNDIILKQINTVMQSSGYMILFGLVYFTMLTETGTFDMLVSGLIKLIGSKMNVVVILVMTTIVGILGYLTASVSTAYLICFPVMLPLFKRFKLDNRVAYIVCQTAIGSIAFLPWGFAVVNTAMIAGCTPVDLAEASIPWGLCFIPVIVLQWIYFSAVHKKKYGTLGLPDCADGNISAAGAEKKAENPNVRPKLLWFNLIVFVIAVTALAYFKIPSYLVFIAASIVTAMVNYPKDFGQIWNKAGVSFFNVLMMLLSICFYLAAFNAVPQDGSGVSMVNALASVLTGIFPQFLMKYIHIIFLIFCVPIIYFVPFQLYNAMYPLLISIGASFGLGSIAVIAPFVCNLSLATGISMMNPSTHLGCGLCELDIKSFTKWGCGIMFVSNIIVVITAVLTGGLAL